MRRSLFFASSIALIAGAFAGTPVFAEEAGGGFEIEEIVVTARKVEENLRDVPVTVNALTEDSIKDRGITSLQDIADATPRFDFAQAFGRNDFRPVIRGQSNIIGRANAGLFIDGIIIEEGNASIPLVALQRVEVVKGPQSALYGRSTLAGAINYVLKTPSDEFDAEGSVEFGERDHVRAEVHVSGPLSDTSRMAFTVSHYDRGGEYDNNFPGNALGTPSYQDEAGGQKTSSFTGVMTFAPSEQPSVRVHGIFEDTSDAQYPIGLLPSSFNNCYRVTRGGPPTQPAPPPGTPEASATTVTSAGYNGSVYYCGQVDVGTVLENSGGGDSTNLETGFFDTSGTDRQSSRLALRLDWDINDRMTLTSTTGFNEVETESAQDQTFGGGDTRLPVVGVGSPFAVQGFGPTPPRIHSRVGFLTSRNDEFEDFSQELRLTYEQGTNLRYVVGVYYYASDEKGDQITSFDTTTSVYLARIFHQFAELWLRDFAPDSCSRPKP